MSTAALHTATSSEWFTPDHIIAAARLCLNGKVDVDPASSDAGNVRVGADEHFTARQNGLAFEWYGRVFLNPPTPPRDWWVKLMTHVAGGNVSRAVYVAYSLEQLSQSQNWGVPSMLDFPVCIPAKRLRYLQHDGFAFKPGMSPPHASAIIGVNVPRSLFREAFGGIGVCL